jgi:AcrR family transcriptional regulator
MSETSAPPVRPGLRERKKAQARLTILTVALEMFAAKGFQATTLAEIAERAGVAPSTLFGYFPSKDDILFDTYAEMFGTLSARLRERPADRSAVESLSDWIDLDRPAVVFADGEEIRRLRIQVIAGEPYLQAEERRRQHEGELLLAEAIGRDMDEDAGALRPRIAAAALWASAVALSKYRDAAEEPGEPDRDALSLFEYVVAYNEAGLATLRSLPDPPY